MTTFASFCLPIRSNCPHRHRDECATHRLNADKHIFNPGTGLRDTVIYSRLTFGPWFVLLSLSLDQRAVPILLQQSLARLGRVTSMCKDILAVIARTASLFEVATVSRAGRVGYDLPDERATFVHVERKPAAEITHIVFLGPGRIGFFPVQRSNPCGIVYLPILSDKALHQHLLGNRPELSATLFHLVLKDPVCCPIRSIECLAQTTETRVIQSIQQKEFHALIRVVIESLYDQNSNHGLGRKRETSAVGAGCTKSHSIDFYSQGLEVVHAPNLSRRIPQVIDLQGRLMRSEEKSAIFDGGLHLYFIGTHFVDMGTILPGQT
jgi:hypothetical protein